jgi:hypothetical protein
MTQNENERLAIYLELYKILALKVGSDDDGAVDFIVNDIDELIKELKK